MPSVTSHLYDHRAGNVWIKSYKHLLVLADSVPFSDILMNAMWFYV